MKSHFFKVSLIGIFVYSISISAMIPNPLLSRGKTVYTSSGTVTSLTDNRFGSNSWQVTDNSWFAIKIDSGPTEIFLNLNNPDYAWASTPIAPNQCPNNNLNLLKDYQILISDNSTDGTDGEWNTVLSITNNPVTARGHKIVFSGANWIKIQIIKGSGYLDEVEVFDISNGAEDIWFFIGTSISANTFKGTPPEKNFADIINEMHPLFTPAMIRAGVSCQNSLGLVNNLSTYMEIGGNASYWVIEHGTNDGWNNGNSGVASFKENLQTVITACKNKGIKPVIAKVIATNTQVTGWQIHSDYQKCIDELNNENDLIEGPDFFSWFSQHPEELNGETDGVHPNVNGAASIHRLWAEKMSSLYQDVKNIKLQQNQSDILKNQFRAECFDNHILLKTPHAGTVSVFSLNGNLLKKIVFQSPGSKTAHVTNGIYIIRFSSNKGLETQKFFIDR